MCLSSEMEGRRDIRCGRKYTLQALVTQKRMLVFITRAVGSHRKILIRESHDPIEVFQILYSKCSIN